MFHGHSRRDFLVKQCLESSTWQCRSLPLGEMSAEGLVLKDGRRLLVLSSEYLLWLLMVAMRNLMEGQPTTVGFFERNSGPFMIFVRKNFPRITPRETE